MNASRPAVPRRSRRSALAALAALTAVALMAGCTTPSDRPLPSSGESPVAEAKAAASGRQPDAEPPRESNARTVDGYKRDAARRIYFRNVALLFDGAPPPVLKSLVVLSIQVDATGNPTRVALVRSNGFRELEEFAIRSVRAGAPLPTPHASLVTRGALSYYETWLFRDDGRFQIRSLAEAQQNVD